MRFTGDAASDPGTTFPEGDYFLKCTAVRSKDKEGNDMKSKAGNFMWALEMTVTEGDYAGRKIFHYLVWLPAGSPGHGMTLRLIHSFGFDPNGDNDYEPEHFLDRTVKVAVKIEPAKDGYEPKNAIKKWYVPEGEAAAAGVDGGSAAEPAEGAEVDTSFVPDESEGGGTAVATKPVAAAPRAASKPAPAKAAAPKPATPAKKPLWGGKKK